MRIVVRLSFSAGCNVLTADLSPLSPALSDHDQAAQGEDRPSHGKPMCPIVRLTLTWRDRVLVLLLSAIAASSLLSA